MRPSNLLGRRDYISPPFETTAREDDGPAVTGVCEQASPRVWRVPLPDRHTGTAWVQWKDTPGAALV